MLDDNTNVDLEGSSPKTTLGSPAIKPPVRSTVYLNRGRRLSLQRSVRNLQMLVHTIPIHTIKFIAATVSTIIDLPYQRRIFV